MSDPFAGSLARLRAAVDDPRQFGLGESDLSRKLALGAPALEAKHLCERGQIAHGQDLRVSRKILQQDFAERVPAAILCAMQDRPDPAETARRVRAAMGYAKAGRAEIAAALGVSASVVDEITGSRTKLRGASWEELRKVSERCRVPFAWFWADFNRLDEIAADAQAPPQYTEGRRTNRLSPAADTVRLAAGRKTPPPGEHEEGAG